MPDTASFIEGNLSYSTGPSLMLFRLSNGVDDAACCKENAMFKCARFGTLVLI
jgi:hypothetical protein